MGLLGDLVFSPGKVESVHPAGLRCFFNMPVYTMP